MAAFPLCACLQTEQEHGPQYRMLESWLQMAGSCCKTSESSLLSLFQASLDIKVEGPARSSPFLFLFSPSLLQYCHTPFCSLHSAHAQNEGLLLLCRSWSR